MGYDLGPDRVSNDDENHYFPILLLIVFSLSV